MFNVTNDYPPPLHPPPTKKGFLTLYLPYPNLYILKPRFEKSVSETYIQRDAFSSQVLCRIFSEETNHPIYIFYRKKDKKLQAQDTYDS